jgi:hypothetical protein
MHLALHHFTQDKKIKAFLAPIVREFGEPTGSEAAATRRSTAENTESYGAHGEGRLARLASPCPPWSFNFLRVESLACEELLSSNG